MTKLWPIGLLLVASLVLPAVAGSKASLLNVSYDPTREFYQDFNAVFAAYWQKTTGQTLEVRQSHGGSGKQARSVIDGLDADVVTLALAYDIDAIAAAGLIPADWQKRLPDNSAPYTSTIVFLVRKGNPKGIRDWGDLIKPGISVVTPNPKTSGGARWNILAAWVYALEANGNDEAKAKQYLATLFKNVPVLDTGARGSTITFVERGIGDVLIAWENEAMLVSRVTKPGAFEVVVPPKSILAEPPVALIDRAAKAHGTTELAKAYLQYLYTPEAQAIAAKHFYRPRDAKVAAENRGVFPELELITIDHPALRGWREAQKKFFADGGIFDQIMLP